MSIVNKIDTLADWLRTNIAQEFNFKIMNSGQTHNANDIQRGHPKVYARYLPTTDRTPTQVIGDEYAAPSIVVMPGDIVRSLEQTTFDARFIFTIWEPGIRDPEINYQQNPEAWKGGDYSGWRDVMNIMDSTARELMRARMIGDMAIKCDRTDNGIQYGIFNSEEATPDLRPFFMGWMQFALSFPTQLNMDIRFDKLLD